MRRLIVMLIAIVGCGLGGATSGAPSQATVCQAGQEATLLGTIVLVKPGEIAVNVTGGDCWTEVTVKFSNGAPPAACVKGSSVKVTGVVEPDEEYGDNFTDPKELSCHPVSTER